MLLQDPLRKPPSPNRCFDISESASSFSTRRINQLRELLQAHGLQAEPKRRSKKRSTRFLLVHPPRIRLKGILVHPSLQVAGAVAAKEGVGRVNRWLMLSAGLIVFALAYVAFYEFVRPRLAQLKWDISDDEDDEDDDFLFYAMITAIIVTTVIVIGGLVISVLIMIGA